MKHAKKMLALLLALCMLIGLPMAVQANNTAEEELKLLYATKVPDVMANRSTDTSTYKNDRSIALYFNKTVDWDPDQLIIRVLGYDKDGNIVSFKTSSGSKESANAGAKLNDKYTMTNPIVVSFDNDKRYFSWFGDAENPIDHFCIAICDASTDLDGEIEGITAEDKALKTTEIFDRNGNRDAVIVRVEEKEDVLVMNSVEILNDRQVHVGFSEAVTINKDDIGNKYHARFGVAKKAYNSTGKSYDYSLQTGYKVAYKSMITIDEDGKGLTALFAVGDIPAVLDSLYTIRQNNSTNDYCLAFAFVEATQDAANGESNDNYFVDAIRAKDTNKPLYVNDFAKNNAFCEVVPALTDAELVDSTTVKVTLSQEAQLKDVRQITVNEQSVTVTAENDRTPDNAIQAASVWTLKVAENLTGIVTVAVKENAFYDVKASTLTICDAKIGDTAYASLSLALDAAEPGDTVTMYANAAVNDPIFMLKPEVKLDLNGNELTVSNAMAFGHVVDTTEGEGKLVVAKTANTILLSDNEALPMYDEDGYRFFSYELVAKGCHVVTAGSVNQYGVSIIFKDVKAYELLAAKADTCGVKLYMDMKYDGKHDMNYKFQDEFIKTYAQACVDVMNGGNSPAKKTIILTISGLNGKSLEVDSVINALPYGEAHIVQNRVDNNTLSAGPTA